MRHFIYVFCLCALAYSQFGAPVDKAAVNNLVCLLVDLCTRFSRAHQGVELRGHRTGVHLAAGHTAGILRWVHRSALLPALCT